MQEKLRIKERKWAIACKYGNMLSTRVKKK
jgi:hypothetical protein